VYILLWPAHQSSYPYIIQGTYQHRRRSCHIPPSTLLHCLHPLIRIRRVDRFGTLKRGFGGGWRILDLLFGSHRSYARYTRVYGLLFVSRRKLVMGRSTRKSGRPGKRRTGKSTIIFQHPPLHSFFHKYQIHIRQSLGDLPELWSESIESSQDSSPTFRGDATSRWIRSLSYISAL
jgi:hypothetical protein